MWFVISRCRRALTLVVLILLESPQLLCQAQPQLATVTDARVIVRAAPTDTAAEVTALGRGTRVVLLEREGGWMRISFGATVGWVPERAMNAAASRRAPANPNASAPRAPPRAERPGPFSIGVFGSVTPIDGIGGQSGSHLAGSAIAQYEIGFLVVYAGPEVGVGAGYRSMMIGGGLGVRLLAAGPVRIRALAGYTTYAESATPDGIAPPAANWSSRGASLGALVTARLLGRLTLAYRGEYVMGLGTESGFRFRRHGFGLMF